MSRWLRVLGLSVPVHTFSSVLTGRERKPVWGRIKFRVWEVLRRPGGWSKVGNSSEGDTANNGRGWKALNREKGWQTPTGIPQGA